MRSGVVTILCVAGVALCGVRHVMAADFQFDGAGYSFGWEGKDATGSIKEYFTGDETPETWKTLITATSHPEATKLADVTGPYYKARQSIVAMPPKAHRAPGGDDTDVVLELFLGAPGRTPHVEYVLSRFIETDTGVYSLVYCRKFPFTGDGDRRIDVDVAIKNGPRWIRELQAVPVESVRRCFLPGGATAPTGGQPQAAVPRGTRTSLPGP